MSWVGHLRDFGAVATVVDDPERPARQARLGIPSAVSSCHTAVVDGYVLEGHVPAELVAALLAERPDAVGLALPGMPGDAPGMGGDAAAWAAQPVLLVGRDGGLSAFTR